MKTKLCTKDFVLKIDSFENIMKETVQTLWDIKKGKRVKAHRKTVSFPDLETLRMVLTPERLRLLQAIKAKKPKSVYELARFLGRKYPNVFVDVKKLEELGFLEPKKEKNKPVFQIPYQAIRIEIPLAIRA